MLGQLACREPGEWDTSAGRTVSQNHSRQTSACAVLESVIQLRVLFAPALEGTLELRKEIQSHFPWGTLSRSTGSGWQKGKRRGKERREGRRREGESGQERIGCGFNTEINISLSSGVGFGRGGTASRPAQVPSPNTADCLHLWFGVNTFEPQQNSDSLNISVRCLAVCPSIPSLCTEFLSCSLDPWSPRTAVSSRAESVHSTLL